jgi:protein TonB
MPVTAVATAAVAPVWLRPAQLKSTSRFGNSTLFAIVVLVHAVAFYVFSHLPQQVTHAIAQPIQVVTLAEPESKDVPLPPTPLPRMPAFDLPIEPVVIDIATPDTSAITVTARPAEPVASNNAAVGTPKTVSSVEYIREPAVKYPPAARALKQHGTVTLRALIDVDGRAREVNVHRSSNFRTLDDAARSAVLNALFKPYVENGHAMPVYVFIPIEFGAAAT